MRILLSSFLLLWLCCAQPACAQRLDKYFWWGMHLTTLQDSMNAQGYWREAGLSEKGQPNTKLQAYSSLDQKTLIVFRLELDLLTKTIVRTEVLTSFARFFDQLISQSKRVSEEVWYHEPSMTILTKSRQDGLILYSRTPDLTHEMEKKLNSVK